MASAEELFISVSPQFYRQSKSSGLMSQAELLHSLKHLRNLSVLARQKNDLRKNFHKLLSSTLKQINAIQDKMPTPQIPKTILRHEEQLSKSKLEPRTEVKKTFSKRDEIEEELLLIQAKLKELNS